MNNIFILCYDFSSLISIPVDPIGNKWSGLFPLFHRIYLACIYSAEIFTAELYLYGTFKLSVLIIWPVPAFL